MVQVLFWFFFVFRWMLEYFDLILSAITIKFIFNSHINIYIYFELYKKCWKSYLELNSILNLLSKKKKKKKKKMAGQGNV